MHAPGDKIAVVSTITVRNISPELRIALKEKAKRSGRSLQQIVLEALIEKVERKSPEEWLCDADATAREYGIAIDRDEVVRTVREMRGDTDS